MRLLSIALLLLIAAGCKQTNKIPDDFDYGQVENGVYKNDFFDMEIPLIPGWDVRSKEAMDQLVEKGAEEMGKKNKKLAAAVKSGQVSTAKLLMLFKYPADSVGATVPTFNASYILFAENLGLRYDIRTGSDYLDASQKLLKQNRTDYKIAPKYTTMKIGDRNFDIMRMTTRGITQLYCCTVEKGFALVMLLSFADEEQEDELQSMLHRISLK